MKKIYTYFIFPLAILGIVAGLNAAPFVSGGGGSGSGTSFSVTDITGQTDDTTPATTATAVLAQGGSLIESTIGQIGTALGLPQTTISGNAGTATALAADPANCAAGQIALGVTAAGVAECTATPSGLTSVGATTFTGALTGNASTASALAADPSDCAALGLATGIAANGNLTCGYAIGTNVQAYNANLAAIAGLTFADVSIIEGTGAGATAVVTSGGGNRILGSNSGNTALEFKSTLAVSALDISAGTSSDPMVVGTATASGVTAAGSMYFESDTEILTIGDGATSINLDMAPNVTYTFPATTGTLPLATHTVQYAATPVVDDADNFDDNFTGDNLYGGTFIVNAAGTIILPEPAAGMNFTIVLEAAAATVIDPLGPGTADAIVMNGLDAADDENITSSTRGALCVFQYRSANHWMATCNGFVEATPP